MATSGSTDFTRTGGQVVTAVCRIFGEKEEGQPIENHWMTSGLEALNMIIKNMMGPGKRIYKGLKVWQRQKATLTLAAQISYDLRASGGDLAIQPPVSIINAMRKNTDDIETLLTEMSLEDYDKISDKTATGTPLKWAYEREIADAGGSGVDRGIFYLDRVPSDITDTIVLTYLRPLEDMDDSANDFDFPQHWYRALKWILAKEMAPEFGQEFSPTMALNLTESIEEATSFYPEKTMGNVFFQPYR